MSWPEFETAHLRLTILRYLADDAEYTINESLLTVLVERMGFTPSRDKMRTELRWLEEQEVLTIEVIGDLYIATLNQRGLDVARGRTAIDGVEKPSPKR